jgi:quinoprotein glucose dehydrogenase
MPLIPDRSGIALALVLAARAAQGHAAGAMAPRTTRDRVYSAEQAARGRTVYKRVCVECHTLDFYRGDIMKPWDGGSLFDLYDAISRLMPQGNPGSLKRQEYADVLAYILSLNGMPAGEQELTARPSGLREIRIKWRDKR